jgi:hypothetical protein
MTMKKIGFYNYYDYYNNNRMFDPNFVSGIGDDLTYPLKFLAYELKKRGIEVSTIDTHPLDEYDAIVFLDFPTCNNRYFQELIRKKTDNMYLFIFENELVRPDNWDPKNYRFFQKVFSWNDNFVDDMKIFKFFLPNRLPNKISFNNEKRSKLCCLIAGNKSSPHEKELYTERIKAIRWFENNAPDSFDLYGHGWDINLFSGVLSPLNRIELMTKMFAPSFPSYKGSITSKKDVLKQYRFSICYENARDIPGYISEKIFDCFFAGCIPVYWGASNITDYIPENTFIDMRKFSDYSELFKFLKQLSEDDYLNYLHAIEEFLHSEKILPFGAKYFANVIFIEILNQN